MITSMTGYGVSSVNNELIDLKIEIKSVNSRYFDVRIRSSRLINYLEDNIRNIINAKLSRGNIDVFIDLKIKDENLISYSIDLNLAKNYYKKLQELGEILNIDSDLNVKDLIELDKNILYKSDIDIVSNKIYEDLIIETLNEALENVLEMRRDEGYNIQTDIHSKIESISDIVSDIKEKSKDVVIDNTKALTERIERILKDKKIEINEDRLYNEIVFYSDKLAIDEEIIRMESHIDLFIDELSKEITSGKRLDFILQEMNRETNTIGSKSNSKFIINKVIELKSIIEKIREQVQNAE